MSRIGHERRDILVSSGLGVDDWMVNANYLTALSPNNTNYITAGCTDGVTYVWDFRMPDKVLHKLEHGCK